MLVGPGAAGFEAAPGYFGLQLGSEQGFNSSRGDELLGKIADLRGSDLVRVRAVLSAPLLPELVAHVIPLLGRDDVARDAVRALRGIAERATGTLADALLDPARDVIVRRRIPRVFERTTSPRAVRALVDGLFEAELEVRHQCALALMRLTEVGTGVSVPVGADSRRRRARAFGRAAAGAIRHVASRRARRRAGLRRCQLCDPRWSGTSST